MTSLSNRKSKKKKYIIQLAPSHLQLLCGYYLKVIVRAKKDTQIIVKSDKTRLFLMKIHTKLIDNLFGVFHFLLIKVLYILYMCIIVNIRLFILYFIVSVLKAHTITLYQDRQYTNV